MKWKWSNVPIPEAYLVVLVVGILLHFLLPRAIFTERWIGIALGGFLLLAGAALAVWAVLEAADVAIDSPDRLFVTGPYAFTRNPMYVGWSLMTLGVALVVNTIWLLALMPLALAYLHVVDTRREERLLEERFGGEWTEYSANVRRYL
jgi:protein-S-isoprenylcysteine O-methyltransferase Ste14